MSLPEGFKQTEVGVIPKDWEVETISGIASVKTGPFGSLLHEKDYVSSGTPIITVEHLGEYGITNENTPNVSDSDKSRLKEYILCKHDIVFSRVGSIDRSALVGDHETGWLFSGRLLRVRVITRRAKTTYLNYHFKSESFRKKIYSVAVGQTMASLNTEILKRVKVPLPPPAEQTAIAAALGDMDALIEGVEKLLEKKRRIKQGAMQELLTGRTRLRGYSKKWETKKLGDIVILYREHIVPSKNPEQMFVHFSLPAFDAGRVPVVEIGAAIKSNKFRVPQYAVLVSKLNPRIPRIWTPEEIPANSIASTEFLVLLPSKQTNRKFLHFVCSSPVFCEKMESSATGTTGSHQRMNPKESLEISLDIPSDFSEQVAIAAILSDMDSEIEELETQLTKYRQLKTGMMQELLTGKKRLV